MRKACLLLLILVLTACAETEPQPPESVNSGSPSSGATASETVTAAEPEPDGEYIIGLAGDKVYLSESVQNELGTGFEFAYIRKPFPFFKDSISDPELFDFDNLEYKGEKPDFPGNEYVRANIGDTLFGAKVTSAMTSYYKYEDENGEVHDGLRSYFIRLEGEVKLEGTLFLYEGEEQYMMESGYLYIYVDPTSENCPNIETNIFGINGRWDTVNSYAHYGEAIRVFLGSVNDYDWDVEGYFKDYPYVKAEITVKDLYIDSGDNGGMGTSAALVSIQ